MRPRAFWVLLLIAACLPLTSASAAEGGPLRQRLRERVLERVDERAISNAPPAARLAPGARITAPGRYEIRLSHAGVDRMALVHVPRAWSASQAAALVMALHGGGGGALYQADDDNYGLISKSESAGFIAVFPNGITGTRSGLLATWNAGNCCAQARERNIDDVGFLKAVVADVHRRLTIDRQRVYAIGMSNGGMMAYRLACDAADVFRGIMAVAGTDNTKSCSPSRPVPVLHIHARNDDRVLFDGGAGQAFRNEALVTNFTSVPATIERWVKRNRAAASAQRVLDVDGAWCELHAGAAPVKLCVTATGGHSWPGGHKPRGEAPSTAVSANDLMWEFFSSLD